MKKFIIGALASSPLLALAQGSPDLGNLATLLRSIGRLVDLALPIVVAIALLAFFWGLAKFIFNAGDEEARKQARATMIWGVIILFVMVAVWGLVRFVGDAVGVTPGGNSGNIPTVEGLPRGR